KLHCNFLQHLWRLRQDSERYFAEDGTDRPVPSWGHLAEPSDGTEDFSRRKADGTVGSLNGVKNKLQNNSGWKEDACRQVLGKCRPTHFESGRGGLITPLGPGSVNPNEALKIILLYTPLCIVQWPKAGKDQSPFNQQMLMMAIIKFLGQEHREYKRKCQK
ncbi:hypothetical protein E2320_007626, partial [Naja naja]